jgi:hypothetical protein
MKKAAKKAKILRGVINQPSRILVRLRAIDAKYSAKFDEVTGDTC